jgi:spore coat polysaccharide biosynthesis protein SpsF (cytidylyltransferase family)
VEPKVTAIIQARMASTRLPGKVMKEVLGQPLLSYLIERVRCCKGIKDIILATTLNSEDDLIATFGSNKDIDVFRGSENNVLERYCKAATRFGAKHIMRLTADCPLIDPEFLDNLIEYYFSQNYDYASNAVVPTLPDGLDAEIFTFRALNHAFHYAVLPSELEHVTPYIFNHPEIFRIGNWLYQEDLSRFRWTVDEPEDFKFVRQVIEILYPVNRNFRMNDVLELICKSPDLAQINTHIKRNEGLLKSLKEDEKFLKTESILPRK